MRRMAVVTEGSARSITLGAMNAGRLAENFAFSALFLDSLLSRCATQARRHRDHSEDEEPGSATRNNAGSAATSALRIGV